MPGAYTRLVHVHMDGNVLRNARPDIRSTSSVICLRFLLTNFYLVYKDEVGGWAPPTELSQSSGAAAHTYTWFSLTTYFLIYSLYSTFIYFSDAV